VKGRNRWLETDGKDLSILQRLQDQERVGAPVKFSMEQVIELFALFVFVTIRLRQANKSLDISEHWQMKSSNKALLKGYLSAIMWEDY
jgi:hypothetical protein